MKRIYPLVLLALFVFCGSHFYAQCGLYPLSLSARTQASSLIVEGTVLSQKSFWNPAGNYMYTSHVVKVNQVLKGTYTETYLEVITEGGEIGLRKQIVEPSLQLKPSDEGVFLLNAAQQPSQFGHTTFIAYSDQQGFIQFDLAEDKASEPFRAYTRINEDLYMALGQAIGAALPSFTNSHKGYSSNSIASVSGISPLTITAGTSSLLTISGSGFGTTQGSSLVEFKNADDGGATYVQPDPSQYVSWSNTQIQVMVPTRAGTVAGTAGTGQVRVTVAGSPTLSTQTLTVDYGELNVAYNGTVFNTRHVDLNGSSGITWQMYTSFDANSSAKASFLRAFQTWRCATNINWIHGSTTSTNVIASDGINVIRFDISTELPSGVLGRCTSYFSGCSQLGNIYWYIDELDICFDDPATSAITWQFGPTAASGSQYDFESVALHELGHGHQLSHVINSGDVMHYALSNAQNKRTLITQNLNAGADVMVRNLLTSVCGFLPMGLLNSALCIVSVPTASFNLSSGTVCVGQSVALNDLSTSTPTAWAWVMTGGSPALSLSQNPSVTYASPGTYTISLIATNLIGPSTILTKTISVVASPSLSVPAATICSGTSTVLTVSGASSYSWNPGNLSGASQTLNPSSTTVYTIQGSNGACAVSKTVQVTVNTTPTLNVANASICSGASTLLTASGASNYTWNPGALTGAVQNLGPVATTTYTVSGTNGLCSANPVTVTITVNTTPTVSVSNASLCSGTSTLLTASGAANYTWNPGSLVGAAQNLSPSSTQVYTVVGSIGTCSSTATLSINVTTSPTVSASNANLCSGNSTLITASGASGYTWNPGNLNGAAQILNPTLTTTYSITGNNGLCTHSLAITVSVTASPTVSVNSASICSGNFAVLTASGATNYTWNPGGFTGASQNLNPGLTTTYTVIGANGTCTHSANGTLSVSNTPTLNAVSSSSICSGNATLITVSGASAYQWNPGSLSGGSQNLNPPTTTVYTITGTIGSCTSAITTSVNVTATPTVSVPNATICAGSPTLITASGAGSYTWNPGPLTGASQNLNPSASTVYTVTGANGTCIHTSTMNLQVNLLPGIFALSSPPEICKGSGSSLLAGGGLSYSWTSSSSSATLNGASVSVSPSVSSTYTVAASDGTCIGTSIVSVQVNPNPTVSVAGASLCVGSTVNLTAIGATDYTWSPGNLTGAGQSLSPTITTVYTVTGSYTTGCRATAISTVIAIARPVMFALSVPTLVCAGQTSTLAAAGAIIYTWNPGNANGPTYTVMPSTNTTYTVIGFDGTCTNSVVVSVSVNPSPNIIIPNLATCSANSVTPNVTTGGAGSFTWNPGNIQSTSPVLNPPVTTIYTVTGVGSNGCSTTVNPTVFVSPSPALNLSTNPVVLCEGKSSTLTASGASSYTWDLGAATGSMAVITPTATGWHYLAGQTGSCVSTTSVFILVNPLPVLSVSASPNTICSGNTATLFVTGGSGYTWSPSGFVGNPETVTPGITTTYTVTGNNTFGCYNTATITVTVSPTPTIIASASPSAICLGNSTTLTATGASNYTWMTGPTPGSVTVYSPTTTTLYYVIGTTGPCSSTAGIVIIVNPNPTVTVLNASICSGASTVLTASGAPLYTWNPGALSGASQTLGPLSTTVYTITGLAATGCSASTTSTVNVTQTPTLFALSIPSVICSGESSTLIANGALNYLWSPGASTSSSINVTPSVSTTYFIYGAVGNCTAATQLTVTVNPNPNLSISASSTSLCSGNSATLNASGAGSYTWMPGNMTGSTNTVSPGSTTSYTLAGNNPATGCTATTSAVLTVITTPTILATSGTATLCSGETATLTASGAATYTWNPGYLSGPSVTVAPNSNTTYTINGSTNGCYGAPATLNLSVTSSPTISATVSSSLICPGEIVIVSASGAGSYTFMPGNISGATATYSPASTTQYTVIAENNGCTGEDLETVQVGICDGLAKVKKAGILKVYPNPFEHALTIEFGTAFTGQVQIYNAIGQLINDHSLREVLHAQLDLEAYSEGVYFLKLIDQNQKVELVKLIKQ